MIVVRTSFVVLAACGSAAQKPAPLQPPPQPAPVEESDPLVDADLEPPVPELARDAAHKLAVPAVPTFDLPPRNADGTVSVRELRVARTQLLDRELTVKGVITWVYDCATDVRKPKESAKAVKKRIDDDPTLCERPKFYIGDSASTPVDTSLWVVDVPRAYNKLELSRLKKADRTMPDRCEPGDTTICVPHKVGDEVLVTATFALRSPHSEANSAGLLVYKRMTNLTQKRETAGGGGIVAAPPRTQPAPVALTPAARTKVAIAKVRRSARVASLEAAHAGTIAYAQQRQLDAAAEAYGRATATWHDNHRAWYALAITHSTRSDWAKAAEAAQRAVELAPDAAMYQLMYGMALYKKAIDGVADRSTINFERTQAHLAAAAALEPALWRAHMLLGLTLRESGRAKEGAAELTQAIAFGPDDPQPWIELAELYRAWDYTDAAIAVGELATSIVPHADVWFELGLAYDEKHLDDKALAALTKAVDGGNVKALFGRGQLHFRKKQYPEAMRDLEQFSQQVPDGHLKQQASRMLMEISGKR